MSIFNFIKSHVHIFDVVNEYTTLKRVGGYFKSCCPFHQEKTASFTVSPNKGIFYCFGCHVHGDAVSFIAKIEQCSPMEAIDILAKRYGIDVPEELRSKDHGPSKDIREKFYTINDLCANWAYQQLQKTPAIKKILNTRGISDQMIETFRIGYFPGGITRTRNFLQYIQQQHYLAQDAIDAHIIAQGKTVAYSPFEERIMFPIHNLMGDIVGFGGRIYKENDQRAKYYNTKEHELFQKGSILFGLYHAKKSIQKQQSVFLVEGYTDCIAMTQHGYTNTVATLGTACTKMHLKLLSRFTSTVYVTYDGDQAGRQAMLKLVSLCLDTDMELKIVPLPIGYDPASYLQEHASLDTALANAQNIFMFYIHELGTQFHTLAIHEKLSRIRAFIATVRNITDTLKQDVLLQEAAKHFDIPYESLKKELHPIEKPQPPKIIPKKITKTPSYTGMPLLEKKFFSAIVNNMQLFGVTGIDGLCDGTQEPIKSILKKLHTAYIAEEFAHLAQGIEFLTPEEQGWAIRIAQEVPIPNYNELQEIINRLAQQQWKEKITRIKHELHHAKHAQNEQEVQKLMHEFIALKKQSVPSLERHNINPQDQGES